MRVDRLLHDLARRPALTARQRSCLALSSMYSILNGRSDEALDGHSWWLRQDSWDMAWNSAVSSTGDSSCSSQHWLSS